MNSIELSNQQPVSLYFHSISYKNQTRRSSKYMPVLSEDSVSYSLIMLIVIILVMLYAFIGNFLEHKHFLYIHQTGVGIIMGIIFALIMWLVKDVTNYEFNQQIFFFGLLPPMIFAGGYNLKKSLFFENFLYISLYGVLGTVVTFGIIFGLTYAINQLSFIKNQYFDQTIVLSVSLMIKYSATICASDSVAALTMIKPSKYPKLFAIVFGQGMINDAVSIILFKVVGPIFDEPLQKNVGILLLQIIGKFLLNVVCSFLIGCLCAMICSKLFKKLRFLQHNSIAEVTLMYMFGILSYVIAEQSEMSGVLTVLICGICLAHFNFYNLSVAGQISTGVAFQTISFLAQALLFIYLGVCTVTYIANPHFSITFIILQLIICALARFTTIFGLSYFVKLFKKKWNVSFYQLLIVSVAGVIRGSVAFALILRISGNHEDSANIVQSSVIIMVCFTTIILGALMPTIINACLKRDKNKNGEPQPLLALEEEEAEEEEKQKKPITGFKKFDEEFLKPFFIYKYKIRRTQIKEFKRTLKLNSPEYTGGQFAIMLRAAQKSMKQHSLSPVQSVKTDKVYEYD